MMEIKRDRYLKQLIESRQNGFIKVVTGIRRCGKSYLLNVLFYHYLLDNGVTDDHIIRIDLEDRMNKELRNPDTMLHYVHDRIKDKELYYIIIDEVQLMDEFVDVLNSFRHIDNADTYVTGSNSHFLSSDIPTEFRGRGETMVYTFANLYPITHHTTSTVYKPLLLIWCINKSPSGTTLISTYKHSECLVVAHHFVENV